MNTQIEHQELISKPQERQRREDLLRRALAAYYHYHPVWKEWSAIHSDWNHPNIFYCRINQWQGVEYVILGNMKGPLAVYRVAVRGQLKRLDDYPAEILGLTI